MRVGVIGLGVMGSAHARRFTQGEIQHAALTAVCDQQEERFEDFPQARGYCDPDAMMDSGEVDAVVIATPHYSHTPLGIAALERGLHVMVEKPVAVHKADAERLCAAWTDPKIQFAAMFNRRANPRYRKLKEIIENGELGRIMRVHWVVTNWFRTQGYYDSGSWRATWKGEGGGVLLNQCPHQLDVWQWLFGMPDTILAEAGVGRYHNIEVEDDVTAILRYRDGLTGVFATTTGEWPGTNRLEIVGEHGRIVLDHEVPGLHLRYTEHPMHELIHSSPERAIPADKTGLRHIQIEIPDAGRSEHALMLQNFVDAITDGVPLIAPATEGLAAVELGNAMLYAGLQQEIVNLPLDGEAYAQMLQKLIDESTYGTGNE